MIVKMVITMGFQQSIEIFNTVGQVVTEKEVSNDTTIDLSAHGTGVYFVKVSNDNGAVMERVVIQ